MSAPGLAVPGTIPEDLLPMLAPGADRFAALCASLSLRKIPWSQATIGSSRHIVVRPGRSPRPNSDGRHGGNERRRILIAHHDAAGDGSGALDNAAACAQLLLLAERLEAGLPAGREISVIFTDSEESAAKGASQQGAYKLAMSLRAGSGAQAGKERPIGPDTEYFIFDVTGRGDTPLLSSSGVELLSSMGKAGGSLGEALRATRAKAQALLLETAGGSWLDAPLPYSDDLGFTLAALPCAAITILPHGEAYRYAARLAEDPATRSATVHGDGARAAGADWPPTWKLLHGSGDDPSTLEPGAFALMARILDRLVAFE